MRVRGRRQEGACPVCGDLSKRVHSRYQRWVKDLPVQGRRVVVVLEARKFFCDEPGCSRRIFCERFPEVVEAYARRTLRLEEIVTAMGLLVSANLASRLSRLLGFPTSGRTLLRCAHRYEPPQTEAMMIGVDDFAFRRGHQYGTLIIDLATRRPIEVLNERSVSSLRAFLAAHPEVEAVCRDRDPRYAEAIRWEAPTATVVLDRWHLIRNFVDAFERFVAQHHRAWLNTLREHQASSIALSERVGTDGGGDGDWVDALITELSPKQRERRRANQQRRQQRYNDIRDLHDKGFNRAAIAQRLQLDRGTVASYLQRGGPPTDTRSRRAPTLLDPYLPHLAKRWQEGCRNAARLHREIQQQGYTGSVRTVMRRVRAWRKHAPAATPPPPAPALPSPRTLAWALLQEPPLTDSLDALLTLAPDAATAAGLARAGLTALRHQDLDAWNAWQDAVAASDVTQLKRFLRGLQNDRDAVTNAFLTTLSNGPTEGHVHRIKLIKRTMYGRASFHLLRNKILYHHG